MVGTDKDGFIREIFHRRISNKITKVLLKTNFNPLAATTVSFILGLIVAILFLLGDYIFLVIGAVIIQISYIFDCVDGELARTDKKRSTRFGVWYDDVSDRIKNVVILSGLAIGYFLKTQDPIILILLVIYISTSFIQNFSMLLGEKIFKKKPKSSYGQLTSSIAKKLNMKSQYINYTGDLVVVLISLGAILNMIQTLFIVLSVIQIIMILIIFYMNIKEKDNFLPYEEE